MNTVFDYNFFPLSPLKGMVSWNEYHHYFLKQHGYTDEYISTHKENHKGMPRELKGKNINLLIFISMKF